MDETEFDVADDGSAVLASAPSGEEAMEEEEWEDWDPDSDSLAEMDRVMTAIAIEWEQGPCWCCGVMISDLIPVEEHLPPPSKPEAIKKARSFFEAAMWNAQIVRRGIPIRKELAAALAAVERLSRLLKGEHEQIGRASGWDREFPSDATEEEYQRWSQEGWCPPSAFLGDRNYLDDPVERVSGASAGFVAAVEALLHEVDREMAVRMFDPPTHAGRPRTSFVERYTYRYLTAVGLRPAEIEHSVGDLARKLREVEDRIGLKKTGKSANPRSLMSTIRRFSARK